MIIRMISDKLYEMISCQHACTVCMSASHLDRAVEGVSTKIMRSTMQSLHVSPLFRKLFFLLFSLLLVLTASVGLFAPAVARAASLPAKHTNIQLSALTMIDQQHGWGLDQDETHVFSTKQGPEHWVSVTPKGLNLTSNDPYNRITASFFSDATHGYLGVLQNGKTLLLSTQDSGRTWRTTPFEIPILSNPVDIHQITFLDARHGWLSFDRNHNQPGHFDILLMSTSDGGKTWQTLFDTSVNPSVLPLPFGQSSNFTFVSPQNGWVTGISLSADVYFYATRDGGKNWSKANIPAIKDSYYVESHGPFWHNSRVGTLFVRYDANSSGESFLLTYQTHDGGQSWTVGTSSPAASSVAFIDLALLNAQEGWSFGLDSNNQYVVHHTSNGGRTWQIFNPTGLVQPASSVIQGAEFLNAKTGWVIIKDANNNLNLYQTRDGGHSWRLLHPGIN